MPHLRKPSLLDRLVGQLSQDLIATTRTSDPQALARWRADPVLWAEERMHVPRATLEWSRNAKYATHKWDGDRDPLAQMLRGLVTHRRIGVESAVGTGKTFALKLAVQWFLECYEGCTVVTIAPKKDQLKLHLWKEIGQSWSRFQRLHPQAELTELRIRMQPNSDYWAAHGFPVATGANEESATKAQGFHAKDMLIIVEETPGVEPAVMTALLNTAVDTHNIILAVGNPDHQLDTLHDFCTRVPGALHLRISALDHPNVVSQPGLIPGAVTQLSIDEKIQRYSGLETPMCRSRVRGISPAESTDALIKLSWCYAARDRGRRLLEELALAGVTRLTDLWAFTELPHALLKSAWERSLGVDVANSRDGDRAAVARGLGHILCSVDSFMCPDSNALGRKLAVELRHFNIDPDHVGVDGVGVGAGTVNEFIHQRLMVQNLMGGSAPVGFTEVLGEEKFKNLRAQMYWLLRNDLQHNRIILPDDETLFQDLIAPQWEAKDKAVVLESKEHIKRRLGRSPDKGDAVVYWNWVRQVRAGTSGGGVMIDL